MSSIRRLGVRSFRWLSRVSSATAAAVALITLACLPAKGHAAAVWGATEWTQIANNFELIIQAESAIDTATNTLKQVEQLTQTLRQLGSGNISAIVGNQSPELARLVGLYDKLKDTKSAYDEVLSTMRNSMAEAQALGKNPAQYLQFRARLAMASSRNYKANYDADIAKVENARQQAQDLNRMINSIPNINSTVGGLQAVVSSNARVIGTLQSMSETIARNAAIASQEKQSDAEDLAAVYEAAERRRAAIAEKPDVQIKLPKPSELTGTAGKM